MSDHDLAWRMEAAFLHAWPALRREPVGDWLLQFAGGVSRRSNSANPRRAQIRDLDAGIAACAARYRAAGMPVLFRLPSIVEPAIEARLAGLGYGAEGDTLTLHADMGAVTARTDPDVVVADRPDADWLTAMIGAQGHTGEKDLAYRRIVEAVAIPAAFVALRDQGQLVSLAYGALHDGFLMVESVVTLAAARGHGHAYRLLTGLMAWGLSQGAQVACLQVATDNHPAVTLYRRLGLRTELYRYHYRREPPLSG